MLTLFLDTHDKNVLVILFKDGKILKKEDIVSTNKHSQITMPTIEKVFSDANIDVNELDNIIVVNGPGSFTGERIAVTIAKTMAYALSIPIRVIDSLSIMALNVNGDKKIVALEDLNGAFVGAFSNGCEKKEEFKYLGKTLYSDYKRDNEVKTISDIDVDYELVCNYVLENVSASNSHEVKPLYIKGISVLNGK